MNTIAFNKTDFPLSTDVLDFLQASAKDIEHLSKIVGDNYILSGCALLDGNLTPGIVVANGEVMPFAGGAPQDNVIVVSTPEVRNVDDASYTRTTKRLEFGEGDGQIAWNEFKGTALLGRIETLETDQAKLKKQRITFTHTKAANAIATPIPLPPGLDYNTILACYITIERSHRGHHGWHLISNSLNDAHYFWTSGQIHLILNPGGMYDHPLFSGYRHLKITLEMETE